MRRLIVGVDPGVTVGLAVLSLDGHPLHIESRREWSLSDIVRRISELGEPTLISSDVSPASEFLEQLSHKLNAVLYEPLISMGADEKRQIAKEYAATYGLKLKNNHEIDALAAAVKAYKHYERKFENIKSRVRDLPLKVSAEDIKDLIVRGYSLKRAIQYLQGTDRYKPSVISRRPIPREERLKGLIEELQRRLARERKRLKAMQEANRKLRAKIRALEAEVKSLREMVKEMQSRQLIEIRREREYALLLDELEEARAKIKEYSIKIEEYKRRFDEMQRLRELESKGRLILLKPIEAFTDRGLRKAFRLYGIRAGDSVLLLDPSGGGAATAEELARRGIKIIVMKGQMSHNALEVFERCMIPVVSYSDIKVEWIEGLPYVNPEDLREAVRRAEEKNASMAYHQLKAILEDHRKKHSQRPDHLII